MSLIQRRGLGLLLLVFVLGAWPNAHAQQEPAPTVEVPGTIPTPASPDRPSQEAVPVKEVPSPAAPSNMPESVGWALGAAYVLQYLKKSQQFKFLTDSSTARAKALFGFVAAFLTAAGIQFTVSGSLFDAGGASVTATGITLIGIKDVLFQWIAQQGWYDLVVKDRAAPAVRT